MSKTQVSLLASDIVDAVFENLLSAFGYDDIFLAKEKSGALILPSRFSYVTEHIIKTVSGKLNPLMAQSKEYLSKLSLKDVHQRKSKLTSYTKEAVSAILQAVKMELDREILQKTALEEKVKLSQLSLLASDFLAAVLENFKTEGFADIGSKTKITALQKEKDEQIVSWGDSLLAKWVHQKKAPKSRILFTSFSEKTYLDRSAALGKSFEQVSPECKTRAAEEILGISKSQIIKTAEQIVYEIINDVESMFNRPVPIFSTICELSSTVAPLPQGTEPQLKPSIKISLGSLMSKSVRDEKSSLETAELRNCSEQVKSEYKRGSTEDILGISKSQITRISEQMISEIMEKVESTVKPHGPVLSVICKLSSKLPTQASSYLHQVTETELKPSKKTSSDLFMSKPQCVYDLDTSEIQSPHSTIKMQSRSMVLPSQVSNIAEEILKTVSGKLKPLVRRSEESVSKLSTKYSKSYSLLAGQDIPATSLKDIQEIESGLSIYTKETVCAILQTIKSELVAITATRENLKLSVENLLAIDYVAALLDMLRTASCTDVVSKMQITPMGKESELSKIISESVSGVHSSLKTDVFRKYFEQLSSDNKIAATEDILGISKSQIIRITEDSISEIIGRVANEFKLPGSFLSTISKSSYSSLANTKIGEEAGNILLQLSEKIYLDRSASLGKSFEQVFFECKTRAAEEILGISKSQIIKTAEQIVYDIIDDVESKVNRPAPIFTTTLEFIIDDVESKVNRPAPIFTTTLELSSTVASLPQGTEPQLKPSIKIASGSLMSKTQVSLLASDIVDAVFENLLCAIGYDDIFAAKEMGVSGTEIHVPISTVESGAPILPSRISYVTEDIIKTVSGKLNPLMAQSKGYLSKLSLKDVHQRKSKLTSYTKEAASAILQAIKMELDRESLQKTALEEKVKLSQLSFLASDFLAAVLENFKTESFADIGSKTKITALQKEKDEQLVSWGDSLLAKWVCRKKASKSRIFTSSSPADTETGPEAGNISLQLSEKIYLDRSDVNLVTTQIVGSVLEQLKKMKNTVVDFVPTMAEIYLLSKYLVTTIAEGMLSWLDILAKLEACTKAKNRKNENPEDKKKTSPRINKELARLGVNQQNCAQTAQLEQQ
ncbi:UNVERIFIED_CONTAM: hypothetical protein FKN15_002339 [Acipenser sinensis]